MISNSLKRESLTNRLIRAEREWKATRNPLALAKLAEADAWDRVEQAKAAIRAENNAEIERAKR